MQRSAISITKNALRISLGDTRGRSGITHSSTTPAITTIPKAPTGGRTTAARPTTTPEAMDASAQATIGATYLTTLGAASAASFVSTIAMEATWYRRFTAQTDIAV